MLPAGRSAAPVVGLTGEAAKEALKAKAGAKVSVGRVSVDRAKGTPGAAEPAPFSSRGPAFDGSPKPDLLAEGAAVTVGRPRHRHRGRRRAGRRPRRPALPPAPRRDACRPA